MVAIECIVIALSRCEVEASIDFFIEQNILHWMENIWIHTNSKLSDKTSSFICIKNLIDAL
ncbi:hypothetical protein AYJ66_17365 [Dietzia cinnamea]|nr:hypothetical protein AYJ66_17365 [Dietzia cinnamea]